ncbi:iron-sulfur cluster biosynthesis family protein [Aeribacillus composti]|uniref:iron-sulfur cluster biosynthesis family protein n=1 Tax=Aeribacillus composti TaxID=1868734 RepID=UPI002E1ACDB8|nr:iron-sulfur cluster biosynthesis family protein [Aeribacillus composti]
MNISFTNAAKAKLKEILEMNENRYIKLKYDTDGCGCVMSGVTALWLVKDLDEDDMKIDTNFVPVYVERSKLVFLDDELQIDYHGQKQIFMLKSPMQIYNPRMSCIVK